MLALATRHGQTLYPCSVRAMRALDENSWAGMSRSVEVKLSDGGYGGRCDGFGRGGRGGGVGLEAVDESGRDVCFRCKQ